MNAGLELMPFQAEGAKLLALSHRAMLVWDPGVGKTPTAVRACVEANAREFWCSARQSPPPSGVSTSRIGATSGTSASRAPATRTGPTRFSTVRGFGLSRSRAPARHRA